MRGLNFKNVVKYAFLSSQCLMFQGCSTWFNSGEKDVAKVDSPSQISKVGQVSSYENSQQEAVRAIPRRPVASEDVVDVQESVIEANTETYGDDVPAPSFVSFGDSISYTVKNGDSLWKIAKKHSVDVSLILQANGFDKSTMLRPGMKINIPGGIEQPMQDNLSTYEVKRGDSLSSIAKRCGMSVKALKDANNIKSDKIFVGQKLNVGGQITSSEVSKSTSGDAKPSKAAQITEDTYAVKAGDTLSVISKRCGKSVSDLMSMNGISDARSLKIGQVLNVGKLDKPVADIKPDVKSEPASVSAVVPAETTVEQSESTPQVSADQDEDIKLDNDDDLFVDDDDSIEIGEENGVVSA